MNATAKKYLLHLATVVVIALVTALAAGPVLPIAGGATIALLARELVAVLPGAK